MGNGMVEVEELVDSMLGRVGVAGMRNVVVRGSGCIGLVGDCFAGSSVAGLMVW